MCFNELRYDKNGSIYMKWVGLCFSKHVSFSFGFGIQFLYFYFLCLIKFMQY